MARLCEECHCESYGQSWDMGASVVIGCHRNHDSQKAPNAMCSPKGFAGCSLTVFVTLVTDDLEHVFNPGSIKSDINSAMGAAECAGAPGYSTRMIWNAWPCGVRRRAYNNI